MMAQKKSSQAFTLIEVLVAVAVLSVILVLLTEVTSQTQKVSRQVKKKVETFRETRAAFEAIARRTGQATLNSYWGYNDPNSPSTWMRQSELHFATVQADSVLSTKAAPACGHAVFFQAPFGYAGSESSSDGDSRFDYMDGLLNGWGYYVEFNSDLPARTPFLQDQTNTWPERKRFRLMELRIPSEQLTVMKPPPATPDGLPAIALETTASGINQWFADPDVRAKYARPIAENVVALLISPRVPDGQTLEGDYSIAPQYSYDSRLYQYENSQRAKTSRHQLPEILDITLIATDEGSWITYEDEHSQAVSELLLKQVNNRFQRVDKYSEDIAELEQWMLDHHLEPRIFRMSISLRGAKFTTNFDI